MGLLIKDIIKMGQNRLENEGCSDPKIDAEMLFCHLMNLDKARLFMKWSDNVEDKQCDLYFDLIETRSSGVPLQYITGYQEFMGMNFTVDENVLIPRQDTETVVEEVLHIVREKGVKHPKILDLCTGSGAIAVSLERFLNDEKVSDLPDIGAEISACDISEKALEVAKKNASANGAKVAFACGDLFEPYNKKLGNKKFDFIVSNPPYIKSDIIPTLQREVKDHEPMLALDGGEDGLEFYSRIIAQAPAFLKKTGMVIFEIGHDQAEDIAKLAAACVIKGEPVYKKTEVLQDLAGRDRIAILYT